MPKKDDSAVETEYRPLTFVKISGQKYAYQAEDLVRENGWLKFTRVNTKTGEKSHLEFREDAVESIETR